MNYVYVITSKVIVDGNLAASNGFMILGVYTDWDVCNREMDTHFKNMQALESAIGSEIVNGLECTKGTIKKKRIFWKDGKITEYSIQERILDQITYASSVEGA